MATKVKKKSNSVKLLDFEVLRNAKLICMNKDCTIQEYVTEAVKEKNQKEKKWVPTR